MSASEIIQRDSILERIKPFIAKDVIKVITGQRRVGKSYVLKQIAASLSVPCIVIDKEDYKFNFIRDYHDLIAYVEEQASNMEHALIIDEIQDIEQFEKALRHFQNNGKHDIYCTGSNANLLSGELATYLSGRYIQFEVHGLSYNEFKTFHSTDDFDQYLIYGGMPYLRHLELHQEVAFLYLKSVYQTIILNDVVQRHSLRNVKFLENLVFYLCNNIGSITSASNISKYLKSQKININITTVINYLKALQNCFFIYEVPRYDIQGKRVFEINHKYYIEDLGIRNSIVGYNQARDDGKLLENIVFMQLLRKRYKVYVGVIGDKEIDFVAEKNNEKIYVQVALNIDSSETMQREFGNLQLISDSYPKYVVTRHGNSKNTIEGINHLSIEEFLNTV